MGKKNNKSGAQPMSPEKYIKEKARMLPLGKCYTYANWKDADEIMVIVTRIHPKGTVTCADFCIDKLCRGLRLNMWHVPYQTGRVRSIPLCASRTGHSPCNGMERLEV